MSTSTILEYVLIGAVIVSLLPVTYASLAGWMNPDSPARQRRGIIAMLTTMIALGTTLLTSAIIQVLDGVYLLAVAQILGLALLALAATLARAKLQDLNQLLATGERVEPAPAQQRRNKRILWAIPALGIAAAALVVTNVARSTPRPY